MRESHTNIPARPIISAFQTMQTNENSTRIQCPPENDLTSRKIASTGTANARMTAKDTYPSAILPATAPSPVAFRSVIPLKALKIAKIRGIDRAKVRTQFPKETTCASGRSY